LEKSGVDREDLSARTRKPEVTSDHSSRERTMGQA
jgi:hypothetical protein